MTVNKDVSGNITVSFPYNPQFVEKIRTIEGRTWHKDKKHWSFPNTDGTLEKILKAFEGEEIQLAPALQGEISSSKTSIPVIASPDKIGAKQSQDTIQIPSLAKRGEGRFSDKNLPSTNFKVYTGVVRTQSEVS